MGQSRSSGSGVAVAKRHQCTKKQAERVIHLYDELDEYDKRPLTYKSVIRKPSTGRFARSKHRSGHVGTKAVAR